MLLVLVGLLFFYIRIYPAKKVASNDVSEASLFFGLLKIVFWEENEMVLIGRRKKVIFDSSNELEINECYIYPILGDQILARVKRGTELLAWEDAEKTPTKEGIRVRIDVSLKWRIKNLKDYVYEINRPNKISSDTINLKTTTDIWLSKTLETEIRRFVRQLTVQKIISYSSKEINTAKIDNGEPDEIEQRVKEVMSTKLSKYGISVTDVEISDIQFEERIQDAIDDIKIALLKQERSFHEGQAEANRLIPIINTLGKEGVILIEAFSKMQGGGFLLGGSPLTNFFDKNQNLSMPKMAKENIFEKHKGNQNKLQIDKPIDDFINWTHFDE